MARRADGSRAGVPAPAHRLSAIPALPTSALALARRGIVLVGTVKSAALVDVVARGRALEEAAAAARAWARARARGDRRRVEPAIGRHRVAAILIGDRSGLGDEDERRLQEAGTYHVIAISGGNIAILAGAAARRVPCRSASAASGRGGRHRASCCSTARLAGGAASVPRAVTGGRRRISPAGRSIIAGRR